MGAIAMGGDERRRAGDVWLGHHLESVDWVIVFVRLEQRCTPRFIGVLMVGKPLDALAFSIHGVVLIGSAASIYRKLVRP